MFADFVKLILFGTPAILGPVEIIPVMLAKIFCICVTSATLATGNPVTGNDFWQSNGI